MVTIIPCRGLLALLPLNRKSFLLSLLLLPAILMWLFHLGLAIGSGIFQPVGRLDPTSTFQTSLMSPDEKPEQDFLAFDLADYPYSPDSNLTVNLVIATVRADDISWTSRLRIPNLQIIRYVSDDVDAPYHPPVAKGREALMYHTYLYDFYNDLPDVSIFMHADETSWHTDAELWSSMLFTLSNLDLSAVVERGYANLRVSWESACPDWINTTKTTESSVEDKPEETLMAAAFRATFGDDVAVPEILGGPCCSQFAVTREAVRRRDRATYEHAMRWLVETRWSDYLAGRTWEHMWPFLFKEEAVDCPLEWKAYCRMYGVCFDGAGDQAEFRERWEERRRLIEGTGVWSEIWDPQRAARGRERLRVLDTELNAHLRRAMERGRAEKAAGSMALGDLYVEESRMLLSRANERQRRRLI